METFVDPQRYEGSCYKASNWQYLGMTTGEGLVRKDKNYTSAPKMIFVKPLLGNFRELLCSEHIANNHSQFVLSQDPISNKFIR